MTLNSVLPNYYYVGQNLLSGVIELFCSRVLIRRLVVIPVLSCNYWGSILLYVRRTGVGKLIAHPRLTLLLLITDTHLGTDATSVASSIDDLRGHRALRLSCVDKGPESRVSCRVLASEKGKVTRLRTFLHLHPPLS